MKWMRERDALIAQTLAFVQSVTCTRDNAGEPAAGPVPEEAVAGVASADVPAPPQPAAISELPKIGAGAAAGPIIPSDFPRELAARIESFRAHQERFNRERAEYFDATLPGSEPLSARSRRFAPVSRSEAEKSPNERDIGRAGREQADRKRELHAFAESMERGSHEWTIRRFWSWSLGVSFFRRLRLVRDSGQRARETPGGSRRRGETSSPSVR
jgi:hypothetical protein